MAKELEYVVVRCDRSSPFAGYLVSRKGAEVVLKDARRIYYWAGAASLSGLAVHGTSKPNECKFPAAVPEILLLDACEIMTATPEAKASIEAVPEWKA